MAAAAEDGDGCNDSYFHHAHHYQRRWDALPPPPPSGLHTHLKKPWNDQSFKRRLCHALPVNHRVYPRSRACSSRHALSVGPTVPYGLWPLAIVLQFQSIYPWRGDSVTGSQNSEYDKVVILSGGGHPRAMLCSKMIWDWKLNSSSGCAIRLGEAMQLCLLYLLWSWTESQRTTYCVM